MEHDNFIKECLVHFSSAGDTTAFSIYDGDVLKDISYRQFTDDILSVAGYFREKSIQNQHIALVSPNSYFWMVVFFATLASGNVVVPMNPSLPNSTIQWQCERADVSVLCGEASVISEFSTLTNIEKFLSFDELANAIPLPLEEIYLAEPDETLLLMFTSGTTGKSKAAEFTYISIRNCLANLSLWFDVPGYERWFCVLPLFHISGLNCIIHFLYGFRTVCLGRGPKYLFMDMPALNPTTITVVPLILESILKVCKNARSPEERIRYFGNNLQRISVCGATVRPDAVQVMLDQGIAIDVYYGLTESFGDGIQCAVDTIHTDTIGKPCGNMQCRIQEGEILLKNDSVMKGYYKDPEETAKVLVNGWLHTGDVGHCDESGYYYLKGRKKNTIILSNGENVNPEEIESALGNCEAILECLVFGDGKGLCADVYVADKAEAAQYIKKYNENVPMYHQVYKVFYSEVPLEKTASGKIKRKDN